MHAISDNKRKRIIDDLYQIDLNLQDTNVDNSESNVRHLMDCRRQLLADLGTLPPNSEASANYPCQLEYTPTTLITEQVKTWRSRVMRSKPDHQSFENPDFCDQILDSALPEKWNFYSDVIVISTPPSIAIISKAIDRSQRHIVIFDQNECIDGGAFSHYFTANIVVCRTISDLEIAFAKLQTPAEQIITIPCSIDPRFITETKSQLAEAIQKGKRNRIANTNTANRFGASWSKITM